ncbi:MAG: YwiC-like family protein [Ignavibacteriaceae bacterium]|nr:YwiC-like family protein [Ignavibacteriaceae bacterium]
MLRADPLINKEHGSWAILLVPPLTTLLALSEFSLLSVIFFLTILSAFLTARPAEIWIQDIINKRPESSRRKNAFFWLSVYTSAAAFFSVILLAMTGRYGILLFGFAGIVMILCSQFLQARSGKTLGRDIAGIAGLTLGAPAAFYIHTGAVSPEALQLWLYNFLFFSSGAFYVHSVIEQAGKKESPEKFSITSKFFLNLSYHIILILFLLFIILNDSPAALGFAFLPMIFHVFASMVMLKGKANFKKIGFTLLGYSIFFGIMIGTM